MDYALLAATALGAIGLYLMLPREKATLARLGGLLSTMALAGFFLFLVRTATSGHPTGGGNGPPVFFYLFGFIMIAGSVGVVCQPKPVYAALYFVLVTLAGAGIFVLLLAEFMAIVLVIIYAGAILVTYVFVIMLASQGSTGGVGGSVAAPEYDRRAAEPFISVLVAFVLVGTILQVLFPTNGRNIAEASLPPEPLMAASLDTDHRPRHPRRRRRCHPRHPPRLHPNRPRRSKNLPPTSKSSVPASTLNTPSPSNSPAFS